MEEIESGSSIVEGTSLLPAVLLEDVCSESRRL